MEGMEEIVQEFLVESHENLDQLDQDLLALERDPNSRELLSSIFRTLHTIKGTSGFLALHTLERVAHAGESLLSKLRDGEMILTAVMATALLEMVDAVRSLLGHIENDGNEGTQEYAELTAKLNALLEGRDPGAVAAAVTGDSAAQAATAEVEASVEVTQVVQTQVVASAQTPLAAAGVATAMAGAVTADAASAAAAAAPAAPTTAASAPDVSADGGSGGATPTAQEAAQTAAAAQVTAAAAAKPTPDPGEGGPKHGRSVADSSIRVDVDLLDSLMNLVGELVLSRNQLVQRAAASQDQELQRSMHRLSLVASELQEG
ncbi:MAG: Hpt domain-containing protein, partial [Micrococcales bacterium]|nr:Hpt domain-containing protein [Micrococcales bacterium]